MMYDMKTYEDLLAYINTLEIVDTHEHLHGSEQAWRDAKCDVISEFLRHYFNIDVVSAGLPVEKTAEVWNPDIPLMERWNMIRPYWMHAKNTGYGRSLHIAARDIYGIDRIDTDTIEELNRRLLKAKSEPGHYDYVLKEKSKIAVSILDAGMNCDRRYFRPVYRVDHFIMGGLQAIENMERKHKIRINRLEDWMEACEADIDDACKKGAVGLKTGLAYNRSLYYGRVPKAAAEEQFGTMTDHFTGNEKHLFGKEFQDYMMHHVLWLANRRGLTYQFHTGLQEGNRNLLVNCDPTHLNNLFIEYPDVKFDVFHMGYPFQSKLGVLSKYFNNVFIDMSWAHIVSPVACVNALVEWLDTIPSNKIFAFGGDYALVDGVYGHQYIARRNVAKALAAKVFDGVFDPGEAKDVAYKLFIDNPKQVFDLK